MIYMIVLGFASYICHVIHASYKFIRALVLSSNVSIRYRNSLHRSETPLVVCFKNSNPPQVAYKPIYNPFPALYVSFTSFSVKRKMSK